jgi:hypothetical protein
VEANLATELQERDRELDAVRCAAAGAARRLALAEAKLAAAPAAATEAHELRELLVASHTDRDLLRAQVAELQGLRGQNALLVADRDQLAARASAADALERGAALLERELRDARSRLERRLEETEGELRRAQAELARVRATGGHRTSGGSSSAALAAVRRELEARDAALISATRLEQQLTQRLTALVTESDELRRRCFELELENDTLTDERAAVRTQVERARDSRAWRLGHGLTSFSRAVTFRRNMGTNALDRALDHLGGETSEADDASTRSTDR